MWFMKSTKFEAQNLNWMYFLSIINFIKDRLSHQLSFFIITAVL